MNTHSEAIAVHGAGVEPCWLTVITPVYNGEPFIERCLRSVVDQQSAGVEHLVVDGGSRDGTAALLDRFSNVIPHLRWLTTPHEGISAALNRAHGLARGSVIGVLNVDDSYEPGVLLRVRTLFEGLPDPSLAVGNCNVLNEEGTLLGVNRPMRLRLTDLLIRDPGNPFFPVNPVSYFYHGSLINRIGPFDLDLPLTMDVDFILRAVPVAHVVHIDEVWGNFWMHAASSTVRDIKAGTAAARYNAITRRHRARLPVRQRIVVELKSIAAAPRLIATRFRKILGGLPLVAHLRKMLRVLPRLTGRASCSQHRPWTTFTPEGRPFESHNSIKALELGRSGRRKRRRIRPGELKGPME